MEESQITNVTPVGEQQSSPVIRDAKTAYVYTDGVDPETEEGAHNGFVFVKEGSGVTFNVPGGPDLKYLNVYTGEWASDITLELLVNGEVEYSATYGNSVTTAGTPAVCNVARLQYYTPSEDDEVEVRVLISHGYDVNWGNMSIQAVTLSDTAPVSLDEKITTPEWEIDHTGGQIQSMKTHDRRRNVYHSDAYRQPRGLYLELQRPPDCDDFRRYGGRWYHHVYRTVSQCE